MANQPATMEASACADALGCLPRNTVMQAVAEQAYAQARLGAEEPTYVRIPKEQWPDHWFHDPKTKLKPIYNYPVCLLKLALYGHPKSGKWWEDHLNSHILLKGWPLSVEWKSCFLQHKSKCFLIVYVDDFKLAGPKENMIAAWNSIRDKMQVGEPANVDHSL